MILKMKKAKIVVLKDDLDILLKSLQRHSVLMIIPPEEESAPDKGVDLQLERTRKGLALMSKLNEKKSFVRELVNVNYEDFVKVDPKNIEYLEQVERTEALIEDIKQENLSLKEEINFYSPWEALDIKLSDFKNTTHTVIHIGFIDGRKVEKFIGLMNQFASEYQLLKGNSNTQAVVFINYYLDDNLVMDEVKLLDFNELALQKIDNTAGEILSDKKKKLLDNEEKIEKLQVELKTLSEDIFKLELLNDQLLSKKELENTEVRETVETSYIEGWLKAEDEEVLRAAITGVTDVYDLDISDPEEGESPPSYTRNNKFVNSFESVTYMFARPGEGDIDPNPAMSFWFWLIFGMMMGDAVYGVLMIIGFFFMIKIKKPKGGSLQLMRMLLYSGIATIIWGVIFGSYLGRTWNPIIEPTADVTEFLILSLAVGALHIITGIILSAYKNIKNGDLVAALVDNLTWVLIIGGIGLFVIPLTKPVGLALVITGAVVILLFGGRSKKGIFGKLIGGLGGLYGIINYASDILSYSRILALALSTAIIGMVMNTLADMVLGIPYAGIVFYILVLTVGHIFNIVMGLLSAYVHGSRLQYIEFFGKFYEGGGYAFTPLSYDLNYIDNVSDESLKKNKNKKLKVERN